MRLVIGSDHAGFELKQELIGYLKAAGHELVDVGTHQNVSCDYPDYAVAACAEVTAGRAERGVLVCGTGIGISITANKVHGIRCALVHNALTARLAWEHNHAQMIAMGARVIDTATAQACLDAWLGAVFEERHQRRIDKIHAAET